MLYVIPDFGAAAITAAAAMYSWRHRATRGAVPLAALLVAATIWSLASAFRVLLVDPEPLPADSGQVTAAQ